MASHDRIASVGLGVIGAAIGGAIGYFAFFWLARQQLYAMMVPGAMLGLGCGLASRVRSPVLGVGCALAAIALGIYTEWKFAPFREDDSLLFFLQNLLDLKPITLILILLGGGCAFFLGIGRARAVAVDQT